MNDRSSIVRIQLTVDPLQIPDAEYLERQLFSMFLTIHRHYNLMPDKNAIYVVRRIVDKMDYILELTRFASRADIPGNQAMLIVEGDRLNAWLSEIEKYESNSNPA